MKQLAHDINIQVAYVPRAVILTFFILLAYLFIIENSNEQIKQKIKGAIKNIWLMLFLITLAFILMSTTFGRQPRNPFRHIFDYFGFVYNGSINMEFLENTFLFIPYSFFFLQTHRTKKPWKNTLILSSVTTCSIEVLQLLSWSGSFQFSDILHNIEGGMIGCGLWCLVCIAKEKHAISLAMKRLIRKIKKITSVIGDKSQKKNRISNKRS